MPDPKRKRSNVYAGRLVGDGKPCVWVNGKELLPGPSQVLRNHSPDGFNWGYGGSGPAQLALAIILHEYNDEELAQEVYQDFKWAFVAGWSQAPESSWTLTSSEIDSWLSTHQVKTTRRDTYL
jgi:hypothetical protein